MAWTEPVTWDSVSKALSVDRLNEQLRDNMDYLHALPAASGWGHNYVRNGHFAGWLAGASAAPDAWVLDAPAGSVAREDAIVKVGTYSAKVTNAANWGQLYQNIPADLVTQLRGQSITLGAWVYASAAERGFISVTDGITVTDSAYHTGAAGWEFLTVTLSAAVDPAATAVSVWMMVAAGAAVDVYFDGVMLTAGPLPSLFQNGINDWAPRLLHYQDATAANFRLGGGLLMQCGRSPGASGDLTITFPVAFSAVPLVVVAVGYGGANTYWLDDITASGFVANRVGAASAGVQWIAIGME
jgi:hypothetical protein